MHTKDVLAEALDAAGLNHMAAKAREAYYHDYLSPLDTPQLVLLEELQRAALTGNAAAIPLRQRVIDGDFDASKEEGDEWAASADGQAAFGRLLGQTPDERFEAEYQAFMAAAFPHPISEEQRLDVRKTFFGGALVMFNAFGDEASVHGGIRPEFIGLVSAKFKALAEEFQGRKPK